MKKYFCFLFFVYFHLFSFANDVVLETNVDDNINVNSNKKKFDDFYTVDNVYIEGLEDTSEEGKSSLFKKKIRDIIEIGNGDIFTLNDIIFINKIKNKILECDFVEKCNIEYCIHEDKKIDLFFILEKAHKITNFVFIGISDSDLEEKLNEEKNNVYAKSEYILSLKKRVEESIGDNNVDVNIKIKEDVNGKTFVEISKIKKKDIYIKNVKFKNNNSIDNNKLLDVLAIVGDREDFISMIKRTYRNIEKEPNLYSLKTQISKIGSFVLQKENKSFSEEKFNKDIFNIIQLYRNNGFLNAKIKSIEIIFYEDNYCDIIYDIEEGEKYFIGDYEINVKKEFSSKFLKKILNFKKGDVYKEQDINRKIFGTQENMFLDGIKVLFDRAGYCDCYVRIKIKSIINNYVSFSIEVEEGQKKKVGEIGIVGNKNTSFKYILAYLDIVPGMEFSSSDIPKSQSYLGQCSALKQDKCVVFPIQDPNKRNTQNIKIITEEKSILEPKIGRIEFRYGDEPYVNSECCKDFFFFHIYPICNIDFLFNNINLKKIFCPWNWKNKKMRAFGEMHKLSLCFNINSKDIKQKTYLTFDINLNIFDHNFLILKGRKISNNINFKIKVTPTEKEADINAILNTEKTKIKDVKRELYFYLSWENSFPLYFFNKVFNVSFAFVNLNINKNKKCLSHSLTFYRDTTSQSFFITNGINFRISLFFPNFLCIIGPIKNLNKKIVKNIVHFDFYKQIFRKLVFKFAATCGLSNQKNSFFFDSCDENNDSWGTYSSKYKEEITVFYMKGMKKSRDDIKYRIIDDNFAFKYNFELRYLLFENVIGVYIFIFSNGYLKSILDSKFIETCIKNKNYLNPFNNFGFGFTLAIPLIGTISICFNPRIGTSELYVD